MGNAGYGNYTEDTKPYVDPERPDANVGNRPSGADQPGEAPKGVEETGDRKAGSPQSSSHMPPAGPHADPRLVNPDATPGTGTLTPSDACDDVDATSG